MYYLFIQTTFDLQSEHKHTRSFLVFTSKRNSLLETNTPFIFLCITFKQTLNIISTDQKLEGPIQFQSLRFSCTFLMAYSKAKLKSNRDKVATSFRSFLIGN